MAVGPGDERRHLPGPGPWEERFWFDASTHEVGVYARLALRPQEGVAWWWAALVRPGEPLLAIRADDVRLPARGTEVRSDGLWACLTCETPLTHWSVGLECYGVSYVDPLEAWASERGDLIPFGLDLEWEASDETQGAPDGYSQVCRVSGEVLLGDERLDIDGAGTREHAWGRPEGPGRWWSTGRGGRCQSEGADRNRTDAHGLPVGTMVDGVAADVRGVSPVKVGSGRGPVYGWWSAVDGATGWAGWWD